MEHEFIPEIFLQIAWSVSTFCGAEIFNFEVNEARKVVRNFGKDYAKVFEANFNRINRMDGAKA